MSCDCCTEKFNKSTRAIVGCPNAECEYKACRECCQTYLLSQSNFGCMGCRAEWSYPHLTTQFTKTFLQGKGKFAESTIRVRNGEDFPLVSSDSVDYMDVSPNQLVSVSAALIPFLGK